MKSTFWTRAASLGLVLLLGSGCAGYRVGNISGKEVQGVHSVFVPMAKNLSYTPDIHTTLTNAVIRRFDNDGTLETVPSSSADSEVDITITELRRNPLRGTQSDVLVTAEYEEVMYAKVTFINRRLGRTVFKDEVFSGRTTYFIQQDAVEGERQALPLAADDLAYNIVKRITEGW